ncbi:hypothetical protein B0T13DRAFT_33136 [Neurospora crassa]|nr:hypothetical protein B0T13DRAFT_33136 [Neurospora crassa]
MQHSPFYTWTNRITTLTANHESKTKSNGNTNRYYSQTTALEVQWWWTSPMPIHSTPYPICFHALLFQRRPMWDVDRHGRGCSVEERASDREQWYCLILPRHPSQVQRWRDTYLHLVLFSASAQNVVESGGCYSHSQQEQSRLSPVLRLMTLVRAHGVINMRSGKWNRNLHSKGRKLRECSPSHTSPSGAEHTFLIRPRPLSLPYEMFGQSVST